MFKLKKNNRGTVLVENTIFIILNLIFLTIMVLFIYSKAGGVSLLEESYAKNIALLVDSSQPEMEIYLDMSDAIEKAEKEGYPVESIVEINGNIVSVKLTKDSGYSYSFFNDVVVERTFDKQNKKGFYFFVKEYA